MRVAIEMPGAMNGFQVCRSQVSNKHFGDALEGALNDLKEWILLEFKFRSDSTPLEKSAKRQHKQGSDSPPPLMPVARGFRRPATTDVGHCFSISANHSSYDLRAPMPTKPQGPTVDEWSEEVVDVGYDVDSVDKDSECVIAASLDGANDNATVIQRWAALVQALDTLENAFDHLLDGSTIKYRPLQLWATAHQTVVWGSCDKEDTYYAFQESSSTNSKGRIHNSSTTRTSVLEWPDRARWSNLIVNPNSYKRAWWLLLCLVLILYDIIMAPITVCFDVGEDFSGHAATRFFVAISWISRVFWSLDMMANFMTGTYVSGILEMKPYGIAVAYAKGWLLFDACILTTQWSTFALDSIGASVDVSVAAVLRALRLVRLLRLLRLAKVEFAVQQVLNTHQEGVKICGAMLKVVFAVVIIVHVHGCLWYGVGRMSFDGWAHEAAVISNSVLHNYMLSMHWAVSQIHGSSISMARTTFEQSFITVSSCLGLYLFTFIVANATFTVMQFNRVNLWKMQATCQRFCDRHNIPQALYTRMQLYLALSHRRVGISERVKDDAALLAAFPWSLRNDIIDEARWPILKRTKLFSFLQALNSRTTRQLYQVAISVLVALEKQTIFEEGDICRNVFIVEFGRFAYCGKGMRITRVARSLRLSNNLSDSEELASGACVSEAVLWTTWSHVGELWATCESTVLVLDPKMCVDIVSESVPMLSSVAFYASKFVAKLNQEEYATDLFHIKLDDDFWREEEVGVDKHFIFLSHYKAEAGTEATLMQEALTSMLLEDVDNPAVQYNAPVFLDSANLEDLTLLRRQVSISDNLVLLLTPGVLTRPWCLVEIATAFQEKVRIVPVEVQRPGLSFKYPDDSFYDQFVSGKILCKADECLLRGEGFHLTEVATSIKHVFTQIALPFSPHKSAQIRQAELSDILRRCGATRQLPVFSVGAGASMRLGVSIK